MPSLESIGTSKSVPATWVGVTLPIQCQSEGPPDAKVMIVGEAPGENEVKLRRPFVGASGYFLDDILKEAGLMRGSCFVTNVCRQRPPDNDIEEWFAFTLKARTPDHKLVQGQWVLPPLVFGRDLLLQEIALVKPTIIIALGNVALWALTGNWGVRKWRSSILPFTHEGHTCKVIPTYHPAAVLREYALKPVFTHDLRRARTELDRGPLIPDPGYRFTIRPTFEQATQTLQTLLRKLDDSICSLPIAADIETRGGHTACLGLAWTIKDAICIPWMCLERPEGYWSPEEEVELIQLTNRILTHPQACIIWQNGAYDHQYEHRYHMIQPNLGWDTMLAHHAMFSISLKSLDFLSSMYCDQHLYWKDDGKTWDPSVPEDRLWTYNCTDCVRTLEIYFAEKEAIQALTPTWPKLPEVVAFQHRVQPTIVRMMLRGVRSDDATRKSMILELEKQCAKLQADIDEFVGGPLNINSPKQVSEYFYLTLGQTPIYSRLPNGARGGFTVDDEALQRIAGREPILKPLITSILALRSGLKFRSTYLDMQRDVDGRLRCSYNVAGTKTYRLSSSENAFGSGGNLQNIPVGDESDDALLLLPNIRKLFLFDPGYMGFDLDGDSADLRIVTGESGCRQMKAYFAAGVKPYVEIAKEFYRDPTITKKHPSYKRMKALCHGTNYGGEAPGLAERIGLPVHQIELMQRWYFGMCPEIKAWQDDIKAQCEKRAYIENPFGYRLYRWDRVSRKLFNEFLAWTPQSTVGLLVNKIAVALEETLPQIQLLLQVHDSLTGQFPISDVGNLPQQILDTASSIVIPCKSGSITVPAGLKMSSKSWGDCE